MFDNFGASERVSLAYSEADKGFTRLKALLPDLAVM